MKILALDCATASCSAALWADGIIVAIERAELPRGQAEALPMIERVRAASGIELDALDRLAVTIGPGHFTGLRAGIATARGLALALGCPLIGVTTLTAVAAAVPPAERRGAVLVVALDSKREEAYVQAFDEGLVPLTRPLARRPGAYADELLQLTSGPLIVVGDAAAPLVAALAAAGKDAALSSASPRPDAGIVAALAAVLSPADAPAAPLYLHAVETTAPRAAVPAP